MKDEYDQTYAFGQTAFERMRMTLELIALGDIDLSPAQLAISVLKEIGHWRSDADKLLEESLVQDSGETPATAKDEREAFRDHLAKCAAEVATWPAWKREALGRHIAPCQRGQFETWAMETKHPVFGFIGDDWLDHGDDPDIYANDYIQGAWVMWRHLHALQRTRPAQTAPPAAQDVSGLVTVPRDLLERVLSLNWSGDSEIRAKSRAELSTALSAYQAAQKEGEV